MVNLKSCRVLVTPRSFGRDDPTLKEELEERVGEVIYNRTGHSLSADEVKNMLPGCHGYIAGLDVIDREALMAADELQVISRYGVGYDRIDLDAAKEQGVVVTNTPGANSVSVAELTLGLMLALSRKIIPANRRSHAGDWRPLRGISIYEKVVGLLGLGSVGKEVARRLTSFGCTVLAYDPYADEAFAREHNVTLTSEEEVVARSDFLSLHVPLLPETKKMVDAAFLAQMKPGAFLINTARGELVDEEALVAALETGHLGGAGVDTVAQEPPDPDHPLLQIPDVIVTPHIGAQADAATNAMGRMSMRDCLAVLAGREPKFRVV